MIPFPMFWQLFKTFFTKDVSELIKVMVLRPFSLIISRLLDIPNLDLIQLAGVRAAGELCEQN